MRKHLIPLAALLAATPALPQASANIAAGRAQPSPLAPAEIVNAAPKGDWMAIAPSDLLVMDLAPDAKGKPRRVVIQLMPARFSQGWIGNIRKLAAARFWDRTSINRVQDNYVAQWGDPNAEDAKKAKALPADLLTVPESEYVTPVKWRRHDDEISHSYWLSPGVSRIEQRSAYAQTEGFHWGWPVAGDLPGMDDLKRGIGGPSHPMDHPKQVWPVHCYGMVGVGRDMPPNTGTGAELYTVIGHAPRHLDRNIALVGRVIEGIEHLSSLPRGTGALGFYETPEERTGIVSVRIGSEVSGLPAYEYLSTESASFARYADARANRRDAFFIRPAGGADVCNIPVPVRRVK